MATLSSWASSSKSCSLQADDSIADTLSVSTSWRGQGRIGVVQPFVRNMSMELVQDLSDHLKTLRTIQVLNHRHVHSILCTYQCLWCFSWYPHRSILLSICAPLFYGRCPRPAKRLCVSTVILRTGWSMAIFGSTSPPSSSSSTPSSSSAGSSARSTVTTTGSLVRSAAGAATAQAIAPLRMSISRLLICTGRSPENQDETRERHTGSSTQQCTCMVVFFLHTTRASKALFAEEESIWAQIAAMSHTTLDT